jgi:hypothetical protein
MRCVMLCCVMLCCVVLCCVVFVICCSSWSVGCSSCSNRLAWWVLYRVSRKNESMVEQRSLHLSTHCASSSSLKIPVHRVVKMSFNELSKATVNTARALARCSSVGSNTSSEAPLSVGVVLVHGRMATQLATTMRFIGTPALINASVVALMDVARTHPSSSRT